MPFRRGAVRVLTAGAVATVLVGGTAPSAFATRGPVVLLTGHVATVVAKAQPGRAAVGSISVTGKVAPARAGRVVLQRKVGKVWKDVGTAGLTAKATFRVRGTSLPVGTLALRVVEVTAHRTPLVSAAFSLLVKAPAAVTAPPQPALPTVPTPAVPVPVPVPAPVEAAPLFPSLVEPVPAFDPTVVDRLQIGYGSDLGGYVGQEFGGGVTIATGPRQWRPVTFTALTALPPGLTLVSSGQIVGRPTVAGRWSITVRAAVDGETSQATYPVVVVEPPAITTPALPDATVGQPYHEVLTVSGGYAPFVWSAVQRDLPPGLTVGADGVVSGTPTAHARRGVLVIVTDGGQQYMESSEKPAWTSRSLDLTAGPLPAAGRTIHVPADQATVQAAIDAADDGDTVLVAPGRYVGGIDFRGKAITVRSEGGAAATVLDAQAPSDALVDSPTVTMDTGEPRAAVLEGFTVTGGLGNEGGGIAISWASPTIEDDVIEGNGAWAYGGGVSVFYGAPLLLGNTFGDNVVGTGIPIGSSLAFQEAVGAEATGNTFTGSPKVQTAGMVAIVGYGVTLSRNDLTLPWSGPAMAFVIHTWNVDSAVRIPNVVEDNVIQGGSVLLDFAAVDFVGNTVVVGGQVSWAVQLTDIDHGTVLADNVLVAYDALIPALTCGDFQAYLGFPKELPTLVDNRVWNAGDPGDDNFPTPAYDTCSGAFSAAAGDTEGDPGFTAYQAVSVESVTPNYLPRAGSPLIDAGTAAVPGLAGLSATDVAGNPRVVRTVDIGAYERP